VNQDMELAVAYYRKIAEEVIDELLDSVKI
jgi:hypothetical protein